MIKKSDKFILICILLLLASTRSVATEIFLAESTDPYLLASFSKEDKLREMLAIEIQMKFSEEFTRAFEEDFDIEKQYLALRSTPADVWEMGLYEKRRKHLEFLAAYPEKSAFSPEFMELVRNQINFHYWHLLLAYPILRSNDNTESRTVTSLPLVMTEALNPARFNQPERLISKSYRAFLPYFVTYFNSKEHKFEKYTAGVQSVTDKVTFAQKNLTGEVLDYTLTQILGQYHTMLTTETFRFWTGQIACKNLRKLLTESYAAKVTEAELARELAIQEAKKESNTSSSVNLIDLNDREFSLDKYLGKVVYIDFWASWCGPCRAEFPNSRKIHETLTDKQKNEIVFLFISIDENLGKWKEAVEKLGLKDFGENGHSFEIAGKFQIRTIPRYMILDKSGKIVQSDAPRPGNPETLNMLLELL